MAYQETNEILNEEHMTAEDRIAQKAALLERDRLKRSGAMKKIAQKILNK